MIEHDDRIRKRSCQIGELGELRVIVQRIKGQSVARKAREPGPELGIEQYALGQFHGRRLDGLVGVPYRTVTHPLEAIACRPQVRLEDSVDLGAKKKIGEPYDARAEAGGAVDAACAHGRNAVDEFGFADRREFRIAAGAIHRIALQEHGGANVVAAGIDIAFEFVKQVARPAIPEMMMRVDDRHRRFHCILAVQGEPIFVDGEEDFLLHLGFADLGIEFHVILP